MSYSVAIIGSFQKHYENVLDAINIFQKNDIYVMSPNKSRITKNRNGFVLFESDNQQYTDVEIQMITLRRILSANVVYVCNPEGYVGRTTCYEIGVCLAKKKPIYFLEKPQDLPIPVNGEQIISPQLLSAVLQPSAFI